MIYEVKEESGQKKLNALAGKATTGIPLGTWLAFENDSAPNIEWIRAGSTFDVNAYPALAMYLGSDKVPERFDHSRLSDYETITLPTSSATAITMQYDGVFDIQINGTSGQQTNIFFYVNGNLITQTSKSGTYILKDRSDFSFKKGDVIYITVSGGSITTKVRYYKHPLFIKATPTSSNSDYEGTLNAVRQYVTNSNSYSTEEVWTGGYWLDGKKIYRKCVDIFKNSILQPNITQNGANYTSNLFPSNVKRITWLTVDQTKPDGYQETQNIKGLYNPSTQTLYFANEGYYVVDATAIFEYTKTTD